LPQKEQYSVFLLSVGAFLLMASPVSTDSY
jgi:hypothetical protein